MIVKVFRILLLSIVLFCVACFAFIYDNNERNANYGVLTSFNSYVKTAPSKLSDNQFVIHEGVKFKIVDVVDNWSRIILLDGNDGWVNNDHFILIEK